MYYAGDVYKLSRMNQGKEEKTKRGLCRSYDSNHRPHRQSLTVAKRKGQVTSNQIRSDQLLSYLESIVLIRSFNESHKVHRFGCKQKKHSVVSLPL